MPAISLPQARGGSCVAGYSSRSFAAHGITHDVFTRGDGPDVIVLHEITGATDEFFDFTDRLAAEHFRVHCPVLFGSPCGRATTLHTAAYFLKACRPFAEIPCTKRSAHGALNPWLVALAADVSGASRQRVGAIGMCLTGIQPLAMLRCRAMVAPVVCQPAVPFGHAHEAERDLGLPAADVDLMRSRVQAEQLDVLAVRYKEDHISPKARIDHLHDLLGDRLRLYDPDGDGHSTLVFPQSKTEAFPQVVAFLHDKLGR